MRPYSLGRSKDDDVHSKYQAFSASPIKFTQHLGIPLVPLLLTLNVIKCQGGSTLSLHLSPVSLGKKKLYLNNFGLLYKVVVVEVRNNKGWDVGSEEVRLLLWE